MSDNNKAESGSPLLVVGGIALMAVGAGLAMTHPRIRRAVLGALKPWLSAMEGPLHASTGKLVSDIQRYWKLRAM
jgi:hypothetical protein